MKEASTAGQAPLRMMLGGDVMLGRMVARACQRFGPEYPLAGIAPAMRAADFSIVNLECALTNAHRLWPGAAKAFYFGAPTSLVRALQSANVRAVSLANNHVLDFGVEGLRDTVATLDSQHVLHCGAGEDLAAARRPAVFDCRGVRFGIASFCDHQRDFAAGGDRPGIAFIDLDRPQEALALLRRQLAPLQARQVDWPILALHWGPNWAAQPSPLFRRIAHEAIDMGWKMIVGHSAHNFQGIELYRGCPLMYSLGDLVDDYAVDPAFRNDQQLLVELTLDRERVAAIRARPVFIDRCQVAFAGASDWQQTAQRFTSACAALGVTVGQDPDQPEALLIRA